MISFQGLTCKFIITLSPNFISAIPPQKKKNPVTIYSLVGEIINFSNTIDLFILN
ncbi:MAG: hypothetical protein CM1200mP30_19550 [Pseudomonadota bacterium]|nr:MAG: hypothetical protein CM1200mP30_19550 [Pseudomonadota bacterium]